MPGKQPKRTNGGKSSSASSGRRTSPLRRRSIAALTISQPGNAFGQNRTLQGTSRDCDHFPSPGRTMRHTSSRRRWSRHHISPSTHRGHLSTLNFGVELRGTGLVPPKGKGLGYPPTEAAPLLASIYRARARASAKAMNDVGRLKGSNGSLKQVPGNLPPSRLPSLGSKESYSWKIGQREKPVRAQCACFPRTGERIDPCVCGASHQPARGSTSRLRL